MGSPGGKRAGLARRAAAPRRRSPAAGSSAPGSAADFACGTGRVLEFLGRFSPPRSVLTYRRTCWRWLVPGVPRATLILGDVTTMPGLAPGPFDLITAFRFFLNAEPPLEVRSWPGCELRCSQAGLIVANFHLNPASLRGMYLRLRMNPAGRVPMMGIADARQLFADNGFTVRQILGYSFLPYRRDGRNLWGPAARRTAEMSMAGSKHPPARRRQLPVGGGARAVRAERLKTYGDSSSSPGLF